MKILVVAPLPPPATGNSLPVEALCHHLREKHTVEIVNLSKKQHVSGRFSLSRCMQILVNIWTVWREHKKYDLVYLTIAESTLGNTRDLLFYLSCRRRLHSVVLHMFGGAGIEKMLANESSIRSKLNRRFLSKVAAIAVEGNTQKETFSRVVNASRIHVVANYAEDCLRTSKDATRRKFEDRGPLRLLFLSNMLPGKGHVELLEAFSILPKDVASSIELHFAGKAVDHAEWFLQEASKYSEVTYHGSVSGELRERLYADAHVFCLPTYYPFEGQPFCILEAYAAGCAVVTTEHSGIPNVFSDGTNGFAVEKRNVDSLVSVIERLVARRSSLYEIAEHNRKLAVGHYSKQRFLKQMSDMLASGEEY